MVVDHQVRFHSPEGASPDPEVATIFYDREGAYCAARAVRGLVIKLPLDALELRHEAQTA